jgi:VWFA-related protein
MRTRLPIAVFVAAASAALLAQATTQDKEQQQPRPTFRTEANYVRVDMYATKDDQPIEDLKPEEIEVLEDGTSQKIATFEYVKVRPAGPQDTRVEPHTVAQSRQAAADPRARVFVIFLDTQHVQIEGSHAMRRPVVQFLDRVIGQDDLVAVMTPEMSAADVAFGRKTTIISKMMGDDWAWGRRERLITEDPKERGYELCYPDEVPRARDVPQTQGIAHEMIERRREKLTFDALNDLIVHLGGIREERKAVLTVSEGWRLYSPNRRLAAAIEVPGRASEVPDGRLPIFVGPEGKLRGGRDPRNVPYGDAATLAECDADRHALAEWDGRIRFRELFEKANRGNVSFYTVYPRGLAVFDSPIGPRRPPPIAGPGETRGNHDTPTTDSESLTSRHNSLRELADNTDGLAVVNTNAIEKAMQRIVSDLTSYYLLGYYSSNTKLDGRFREITVRVKRPGVRVRARRGYRGTTAEELTAAATAEKAKSPTPVTKAFDSVAAVSPRSQLRIRASAWNATTSSDMPAAAIWIVGEVDYRTRRELAWSAGATAEVVVVTATGVDIASKTIDLPAGQGSFTARVPDAGGVPPGEYAVRIRVKPTQDPALPVSDTARVIVPAEAGGVGESVLWRRGPTTGPRYATTADPRFQRSERIRLEHATTAAGTAAARLLDRGGKVINVPVQVTDRQDASGEFRWLVAEAALAPLAPGDYAIELSLDEAKVVTAFKVVP